MDPQLADIQKQITAATEHARKLFAGLTEEQLKKRPSSGGWSIAECVQHLIQTNVQYDGIFDSTFPSAPKGSGPFKKDFKGRLLAWIMEPPYRSKVKTTPHLEPTPIESAAKVLSEFETSQAKLAEYVAKADGLALDKIIITSPYDGRMKYNLLSCLGIITSHQRRHLWQAEQILKQT